MKKLILLLALAFVMCGCNPPKIRPLKTSNDICNINGWNCSIIEIDSCEYIQGGYLLSHKGNCKYCVERHKKELEDLRKAMED